MGLVGVMYPSLKPPHIQKESDRNKQPEVSDFVVDLGLPAETVKEKVKIGTPVTMKRDFLELGDCVSCKSMDNRVSVYIMIRAMQSATKFGFELCGCYITGRDRAT